MPAWPTFETLIGVIVVLGIVYYAIAVRGSVADVESDKATGEALIG